MQHGANVLVFEFNRGLAARLEYLTQGGVTFRFVEFLLFFFQEEHFEVGPNSSVHL